MSEINNDLIIHKYLDLAGLQRLWSKIGENFTTKAHVEGIKTEFEEGLNNLSTELEELDSYVTEIANGLGDVVSSTADGLTIVADNGGKLSSAIRLHLDKESQMIQLVDAKDNILEGRGISYSDFVKDGMLKSVELAVIEEDTDEHLAGTYLVFSFNTDGGTDKIHVNVSDLVNLYEGSEYILVEGNKIQLKHASLVDNLKTTFVTLEDFNSNKASVTESISKLTTDLSNLQASLTEGLTTVSNQVLENKTNIEAHGVQLGELNTAIGTNTESIGDLNTRVSENLANINALWGALNEKAEEDAAKITDLEAADKDLEAQIKTLEDKITNMEGAVGPDGTLITISINQVTDFEAMSDKDIDDVCKVTEIVE